LSTQGDGDGVLLRVDRVTFEQVIGSYRDRDLLALIHVDYGQSFDLHHCVASRPLFGLEVRFSFCLSTVPLLFAFSGQR
jgi:hypothetical protein